jgi:hypothetical protein
MQDLPGDSTKNLASEVQDVLPGFEPGYPSAARVSFWTWMNSAPGFGVLLYIWMKDLSVDPRTSAYVL